MLTGLLAYLAGVGISLAWHACAHAMSNTRADKPKGLGKRAAEGAGQTIHNGDILP